MNKENTKKIDVGTCLTTSFRDYVESIGKSVQDYDTVGVRGSIDEFRIPLECDAVVDLRTDGDVVMGTALIKRKNFSSGEMKQILNKNRTLRQRVFGRPDNLTEFIERAKSDGQTSAKLSLNYIYHGITFTDRFFASYDDGRMKTGVAKYMSDYSNVHDRRKEMEDEIVARLEKAGMSVTGVTGR
ncbi:hypothetical protein HY450_00370 [Candidatus Pacearchaeota archaeon]|nr:hypothetical protein [Candidatus Pacearchaeota archaeon]